MRKKRYVQMTAIATTAAVCVPKLSVTSPSTGGTIPPPAMPITSRDDTSLAFYGTFFIDTENMIEKRLA